MEELREAVLSLQGAGSRRLEEFPPDVVRRARLFLQKASKKALPAPRAPAQAKGRARKQSKWSRVASLIEEDAKRPANPPAYYVHPANGDEASLVTPLDGLRGAGRKPLTDREHWARAVVIKAAYRESWIDRKLGDRLKKRRAPLGSDRGLLTKQKLAAEEASYSIIKKYNIAVGAAEVERFIKEMPPADRILLLELPSPHAVDKSTRKKVVAQVHKRWRDALRRPGDQAAARPRARRKGLQARIEEGKRRK